MTTARSSGVMGPTWLCGGTISARSTIRGAVGVQKRHQSLAHGQLADDILGIESRIGPGKPGRGAHGLLFSGVKRPQGVLLHAIAELAQHAVRHVRRVLAHKIDPTPASESNASPARSLQQHGRRPSKSKWASSKKKTRCGLSVSPTSGRRSNSSTTARAIRWNKDAARSSARRRPGC